MSRIGSTGTAVPPDGSITTAKLANDAVSADKLQEGAVTADKIADFCVGEQQLEQLHAGGDTFGEPGKVISEIEYDQAGRIVDVTVEDPGDVATPRWLKIIAAGGHVGEPFGGGSVAKDTIFFIPFHTGNLPIVKSLGVVGAVGMGPSVNVRYGLYAVDEETGEPGERLAHDTQVIEEETLHLCTFNYNAGRNRLLYAAVQIEDNAGILTMGISRQTFLGLDVDGANVKPVLGWDFPQLYSGGMIDPGGINGPLLDNETTPLILVRLGAS